LGPRLPRQLSSIGLLALSAFIVIAAALTVKRYWRVSPVLCFSAACSAAILVSYHAFAQDLVLLFLPAVLQANWASLHKPSPGMSFILFLAPAVLFLTPLCILLIAHHILNAYAVLLLIWLVSAARAARLNGTVSHP
jgi:hypothetical protein